MPFNKKLSTTFIKNVYRFHKQRDKLEALERAYNTHSSKYYAKAKRQNLLSNQYAVYKNIDPFKLKPTELNNILKANARAIRELGFSGDISGDLAEASVLTELNNEAYRVSTWADSEEETVDRLYLELEQDRVFGEMLYKSLRELRLKPHQLDKLLSRSILPEGIKAEVKVSLIDYWKKLRK